MSSKIVLTYGTFDLLHVGHIRLFKRLKEFGDFLIVGVSTDSFNIQKGKQSFQCFEDRLEIVSALRYVDQVIPEEHWDQKIVDIKKYKADLFGMGDDWLGKFDYLQTHCQVIYLPRTEGISSTVRRDFINIKDHDQEKDL